MQNEGYAVVKSTMYNLLLGCYVAACAACSFAPRKSLIFLIAAGAVIALPYFFMQASKMLLAGLLISIVLLVVSIMIPVLAFLPLLWAGIAIILKFGRFLRNLPLILAGILLYGAAALIPHGVIMLISPGLPLSASISLKILTAIVMGILGYLAMHGLIALFERWGYSKAHSAAVMLGFTSYLLIFLIMLLLPFDADHGDVDGFDWDS